ncbi:hypothetical protein BKA64DRAFT_329252 [Cadophora sp. MPI-SDFR-AT-0126]|nr:hypothetical protein BKA64DRAFT_329252 [Leotiomycetes sp. MPI-SDFR-AT-0126]
MGSSASKASKVASKLPSAATNTARKYPTRTPPAAATANAQTRRSKAAPEGRLGGVAQAEREGRRQDEAANTIDPDSDLNPDPALNARLKTLGPVQPNPTHSPSSTFHSHSQTTSSFADPTLSATQFQPSASNPLQTIFPSSSPPPGTSNTSSSAGSSSNTRERERLGSNPAVSLLTARYRLAGEAENEFARTGKSTAAEGRQFLDVLTLRQILVLRDEKGVEAGEIERRLGLKRGVVGRLGRRGVVSVGS